MLISFFRFTDSEPRLKTTLMNGLPVNMLPLPSHKTHINKSALRTSSIWRTFMRRQRNPTSYPDSGSICSRWQGMWLLCVNDLLIYLPLQEACQSWCHRYQVQTSRTLTRRYWGGQEGMGVLFSLKARMRCKVVLGLFYAINSINYPTYIFIHCIKYHTL